MCMYKRIHHICINQTGGERTEQDDRGIGRDAVHRQEYQHLPPLPSPAHVYHQNHVAAAAGRCGAHLLRGCR